MERFEVRNRPRAAAAQWLLRRLLLLLLQLLLLQLPLLLLLQLLLQLVLLQPQLILSVVGPLSVSTHGRTEGRRWDHGTLLLMLLLMLHRCAEVDSGRNGRGGKVHLLCRRLHHLELQLPLLLLQLLNLHLNVEREVRLGDAQVGHGIGEQTLRADTTSTGRGS